MVTVGRVAVRRSTCNCDRRRSSSPGWLAEYKYFFEQSPGTSQTECRVMIHAGKNVVSSEAFPVDIRGLDDGR